MATYRLAAAKYRPKRVRVLFVAESPPARQKNERARYFYLEDVEKADQLWSGLMQALYADFGSAAGQRDRKAAWLDRFARDGYWLIDAVKAPIVKKTSDGESISRKALRDRLAKRKQALIKEIDTIKPKKVVLISAPVYEALCRPLREAGVPVVNTRALPFPGSGQQGMFQRQFIELHQREGLRPERSKPANRARQVCRCFRRAIGSRKP